MTIRLALANIYGYYFVCILCSVYGVESRKNVLFLVSDDMRPELGCFQGKDFPSSIHPPMTTPNLDSLAKESLVLKRAYVQQAVCSPSRTSLLTGRRPDTTHVYDLIQYFREVGGNFTTIPQYFKQNGYVSVGMGKIFHPGHASHHDDPISWSLPYFHAYRYWENNHNSWAAIPDEQLKDKPLEDYQIMNHALKTLRMFGEGGQYEGRPFFVAVGFHRPHLPFVFPKSFLKLYPNESIRLPDNQYAPGGMPKAAWNGNDEIRAYRDIQKIHYSGDINTTLPTEIVHALRRGYYSALSWTDSLIGKVIGELSSLGLRGNTIISFWGDHGWQLGEHGEWGKQTNFELATHAPMMVHVPGLTDHGVVSENLTEFVDLFPTLADAAGLPPIELCPEVSKDVALCREGQSLIQLVSGGKWKTVAFSQFPRSLGLGRHVMGYTLRTDRYRYTEWPVFSYDTYKPDWEDLYGVELYDHLVDQDENTNRADEELYKDIVAELSKILKTGWRSAIFQDRMFQIKTSLL